MGAISEAITKDIGEFTRKRESHARLAKPRLRELYKARARHFIALNVSVGELLRDGLTLRLQNRKTCI